VPVNFTQISGELTCPCLLNSLGSNHANRPSYFCSFDELGTLLGIDPRKVSPFAEIFITLSSHLLNPSEFSQSGVCFSFVLISDKNFREDLVIMHDI
jgi:hypothetical protein